MRIDLNLGISPAADSATPVKPDIAVGSGPKNSDLAGDVASPSADYARAQALTAALSQVPDVREEKVAALAQMVHSGSYTVSPEQTAEALMAHMADRAAA